MGLTVLFIVFVIVLVAVTAWLLLGSSSKAQHDIDGFRERETNALGVSEGPRGGRTSTSATKPTPAPVATTKPVRDPAPTSADPIPTEKPVVASAVAPVSDTTASAAPNIAPAEGESDDLTKINGIGPKLAGLLNDLGVRRFDQISDWNAREVAEVDAHLGNFRGRIDRDKWIEQASLLAAGNHAEWKQRFGTKRK
ncbi:hypothetical protein [Aurantiacibacter sediminis]|uniref:Uncharacterized protein n=1 Tax=Aurantiacibacter sediminis TaxID=2793064 RepID=A0ABS0N6H6_9SPHN|nr:hypothetical protein [Aurantiacibacter sediminis]MBH5323368.1 hypothetical protein [Aurantiacibacter sediminis]